ncbi:YfbK domain-containing protein [Shewanella donghaensis]|uniref:YfbK domain-containing protein n=1 Tax=Shewanella donghaensis TaxID=238836 RepID=UPI001183B8AB|nr:von Willebrand factor type A domain-containing protein [Shewanella donghaensis]
MNTLIKSQAYNLVLLTLVGFNVIAADNPPVSVEPISQPAVVQARVDNPTANPIKPNYPPIKRGYNTHHRLVLDGHGGNMVTGETPESRLTFKTDDDDYSLLKQYLENKELPAKNIIHSQYLLNSFKYDFADYQTLSKNYAMYTELAPSPYNADTLLLLIQIKLTDKASDKAKFSFPFVQAQLRFNPKLISEYRLVGFEHDYSNYAKQNNDSRAQNIPVNQYGQYTALYELRQNEHNSYTLGEQTNDEQVIDKRTSDKQKSTGRYSAGRYIEGQLSADSLAELSLQDARSSSTQQFVSNITIGMALKDKFFEQATDNFRFAAAVAGLGQLINANNYVHQFNYNDVISIAIESKGEDLQGQREEFVSIAKQAFEVSSTQPINKLKPHQREPYPMPKPIYDKKPKTGYPIGDKPTPIPPKSALKSLLN